jgi:hypothetical protein
VGSFLTGWASISFSRILLYGVTSSLTPASMAYTVKLYGWQPRHKSCSWQQQQIHQRIRSTKTCLSMGNVLRREDLVTPCLPHRHRNVKRTVLYRILTWLSLRFYCSPEPVQQHSICSVLQTASNVRDRKKPEINLSALDNYGLDDRWFESRLDWELFSSPPRPDRLWGLPSILSNWYQGFFPWG